MLTDTQFSAFRRDGFLAVEGVIGEETLAPLRDEYRNLMDRLYAGWEAGGMVGPAGGNDFWGKLQAAYDAGLDWFQPMDISLPGDTIQADTPMHFGPAVFGLVTAPAILDAVESLIGPEITSNPIQHVRIKPPARTLKPGEIRAHVGGTDWHQDRAVAHEEADSTRMVTVWVAVTDATVENGCLQCVPKAPAQEMLPHCPQRQTAIAPGFLDVADARPLPVKAGGVVIFDPMTPHGSLDNTSDGFRWSFDLRYNVTGEPTGRSHFPEFVARSASAPETVLDDWRVWKSMWEDARAELSAVPHIPIHRWRADSPVCA